MAENTKRDNNGVVALIGASSADGITPIRVQADPTDHTLMISAGSTGTDHGTPNAKRDQNYIPVMIAASSDDGETPVEVYVNPSTGELLVDSN